MYIHINHFNYTITIVSPENIRDLISKDDIEAICFDKDNCITLPFDNEIHQKVRVRNKIA